jgi:hypothetical protein
MNRALLVGLKSVDSSAYGGWDGQNGCYGCELDVDNVERIVQPLGYKTKILTTASAKASTVITSLELASQECEPGDTFVFYFSGHGGQQPDANSDESDGQDETLVAYDRQITDDELNAIWPEFRAGVKIFMLSDSCNSGTNYKMSLRDIASSTPMRMFSNKSGTNKSGKRATRSAMKAQMIHFGGCRDGATSAGYQFGGAFTGALCDSWNGGDFIGDYRSFFESIKSKVTGQEVQYNEYGPVDDSYRKERPFGSARTGEPIKGQLKSFKCTIEIDADHLSSLKQTIRDRAVDVMLDSIDDALSHRPFSGSVSCSGSSGGGGVSCTGSVGWSG